MQLSPIRHWWGTHDGWFAWRRILFLCMGGWAISPCLVAMLSCTSMFQPDRCVAVRYTLVYRDRWNFGGIKAEVPADVSPEAADVAETQAASQPTGFYDSYESQWDIHHYLPPALQRSFRGTIMEFIASPWAHAHQNTDSSTGASQGGTQVQFSSLSCRLCCPSAPFRPPRLH